ncbi:hypothetical protein [Microbacterium kyungheense]|uniref:hypothetical protein n=1 Tax=Microbacterium kyungheense TaxID=1263636 RepID=UPI0031ED5968
MFAVYAAEQQYRHDSRIREKERLIRSAIRERSAAPALLGVLTSPTSATAAAARPEAAAWPRPIGIRVPEDAVVRCAVA